MLKFPKFRKETDLDIVIRYCEMRAVQLHEISESHHDPEIRLLAGRDARFMVGEVNALEAIQNDSPVKLQIKKKI